MATTRLGLPGVPWRPYAVFVAKTELVVTSVRTIYVGGTPSEISVSPASPATIVVLPGSRRTIQTRKPRM